MPDGGAEWLVEEGIGETRALLVEDEQVVAAKVRWPGEMVAGSILEAKLTSKASGARRGTATSEQGQEILVDHLPASLTEGEAVTLRISRAPIAERGRLKHAQGRFVEEQNLSADRAAEWLPEARTVRSFPAGLWEEVWDTASSGTIEFQSGQIMVCVTPAMTLIDVDGPDNPGRTANASVTAVGKAVRWFDLGGSIGIDFPTAHSKADRKYVDSLLGAELHDYPHERTAMNGFGFVQLVARLEGPSLLHRFATSRVGMCARMALRRAELAEGTGRTLLLTVHPALKAKLKDRWLDELAKRTGKEVRIETNPKLALEAGQAQIVAS
ncbi:MAG: ribonuclease [Pseudomonadota bacterium]